MANESSLAAVLEGQERNEPYHSDLANAGTLTLQVAQAPRKSKYPDQREDYPGKPEQRLYCYLKVQGDDKRYSYEPDTWWVADALRKVPKNTWLEAEFHGAKEDADVVFRANNGELLVDTREWDKSEARRQGAADAAAAGQGPETPAGQEERERAAATQPGERTVAHLYMDGLLNASVVLSRVVEELGLMPEEEQPGHVGPVPVTEWLGLCQKVGTGMVIHADRTGMPIGPVQSDGGEDEPAAAGSVGGQASTEPGSVTVTQREVVQQLAGVVELTETQQDSVDYVLEGYASEKQAESLLAALTQLVNGSGGAGSGDGAADDDSGRQPRAQPAPAGDDLPF